MAGKKSILDKIRTHYQALKDAEAEAAIYHRRYLEEVNAAYAQETAAANAERDQKTAEAEQTFQATLTKARQDVAGAVDNLGLIAAPWDSSLWQSFDPSLPRRAREKAAKLAEGNGWGGHDDAPQVDNVWTDGGTTIPGGSRAGRLIVPNVNLGAVPAMFPLIGQGHLFISSSGATKNAALDLLQSIVTRVAVTFPPLSARFVFIDPVVLGSTFPFERLPEAIRGDTIYTETDDIRFQMREMTEHIKKVQNKYLAREFDSIEKYNERANEIVEAYRFLCIADFPAKFDPDTAARLLSVAEKGVTTGVYLLMHINSDMAPPRDFALDALLRTGTVITAGSDGFALPLGGRRMTPEGPTEGPRYQFVPDSPPDKHLFNRLMDKVTAEAAHGGFKGIPFARIAAPREKWWMGDSRRMVDAPIGVTGVTTPLNFWLGSKDGRNSPHALISGRAGSGKSTLFHVYIASLVTNYSPDEVELYLIDFKEGVEFKAYADAALPHARVIAIESEREFGLSVLKELQAELERRGDLFKEVNAQDIFAYRERTGALLPRILLVIDEFQVLLIENDEITSKSSLILEDLARRGRAFGIHLVFGSQSFRGIDMSQTAKDQFATRIVLQSSEAEVASMLGPDNTAEAMLLERPGEMIFNDDGGRRDRNQPGQVALLQEDGLTELLRDVNDTAAAKSFARRQPLIVFRGNEASDIIENPQLQKLYDLLDWPTVPVAKETLGLRDWIAVESPALGWLGEAIEIRPHTAAVFRRRPRANLLMVGDVESTIFGMVNSLCLSLTGFYSPDHLQIRIIDFSLRDEAWSDACEMFADTFDSHNIQVVERRNGLQMLDQVHQMVTRRQEQLKAGHEELGPSIYFFVAGAHRMPELRPVPGRFSGYEPSEAAGRLLEIAQFGPEVGVHLIAWYDRVKSFDDQLGRQALGQFDRRVALPMSPEDSTFLLRGPAAGKLPRFRALLHDEERSQPLEKFKPYALPDRPEARVKLFEHFASRLRWRMR